MEAIIDYRGKTPKKQVSGVPLITAKIVKNGTIMPFQEYIAHSDYDSWMSRGLPKQGDIIMTTEAPLGEVAQLDQKKVALAQRIITLRGRCDVLDNTFLKFLMQSSFVQSQLHARASGTTVLGIKQSELRKIMLLVPPISEQRAIAAILGALDDKIELNRQMNKTLEAIAQATFKSWFTDFDPVRYKAAGKEPPGLAPEIAALFPDSFEDSELGEIPEGWEVNTLADLFEINPERKLVKGTLAPYLDMSNMPVQGHAPNQWIKRETGSGSKFINGDTLVARITPCLENGKTAYVDFLSKDEVGWGSTEYLVFRPKDPFPLQLAYLVARNERFRNYAVGRMTGSSGRQRVSRDAIESFPVVLPLEKSRILTYWGSLVESKFNQMKSNQHQSRLLVKIRDTLLPKLISGELRVPEAERIIGMSL